MAPKKIIKIKVINAYYSSAYVYFLCINNRIFSVILQYKNVFFDKFFRKEITMSLYTAIKKVAKQSDKSVYRIEKDLNLSNGSISKWNKSEPSAVKLTQVAAYLGVTPQYLLILAEEDKNERTNQSNSKK